MAVLQLRYNGDDILRKRCREVETVDDRVRRQLDDMMDTLHATDNGAALAANQVGILRRLVVMDMEGRTLAVKEGDTLCLGVPAAPRSVLKGASACPAGMAKPSGPKR